MWDWRSAGSSCAAGPSGTRHCAILCALGMDTGLAQSAECISGAFVFSIPEIPGHLIQGELGASVPRSAGTRTQ